MNNSCSINEDCGCVNDKAWAVVNKENKTLHRVTFSRSVAQQICDDSNDPQEVARITFELKESTQPLWAVVSNIKNKTRVLRIALSKDIATFLANDDSRRVEPCTVTKVHLI